MIFNHLVNLGQRFLEFTVSFGLLSGKNWMKFKGLQLQDTLIHSRIPFPSLSKQNLLGVLSEGNVLMYDFVIRANFTLSLKGKFFAFALVGW